jgi:hypothetical protein
LGCSVLQPVYLGVFTGKLPLPQESTRRLRSKWGIAAARIIAKRIAEHIAEAARRDDALGAAHS